MNKTGIKPIEYKVLIKPDKFEEKSGGGIYFPDDARDRLQHAQDRGTIIDCSDMAFSDWKGRKPKIGEKVIFNKYSGSLINIREKSDIGGDYRICNDKDIVAIWEEYDGRDK